MEDANEKLQRIIIGYACNLQAELKHRSENFDYAEIEFPMSLLQEINSEFSGDFGLRELIQNFNPEYGGMGCLKGYHISEIIGVRIAGERVHLDVAVHR